LNLLRLRYRRAWIGSIWLLVLVIVVGSLMPATGPAPVTGFDKIEHVVAYFTLALLGSAVVTAGRLPWVMARVMILGLALEAMQALVTVSRTADWADVLADAIGVLTAWWIVRRRAGWAVTAEAWLAELQRR
jgi:VanZ family protein